MRLIRSFNSFSDAQIFAEKFEDKGIMCFVSSKYSSALSKAKTGALTSCVWIVLPDQYEDASAFLENHSHEVRNPISKSDMEEMRMKNRKIATQKMVVYTAFFAASIVSAVLIFVFFLSRF